MGEVWRARDPRLDRDVALKLLPERFLGNPDALARVRREAKLLAALSHSHIATLYGVEESGEALALVMELVEGETLAGRLKRGSPPMAEVLRLARQIAGALEAAHDRGVLARSATTVAGRRRGGGLHLARPASPRPEPVAKTERLGQAGCPFRWTCSSDETIMIACPLSCRFGTCPAIFTGG